MSFHCSWLSLLLNCCLLPLPFVISEKCPVQEVYAKGPVDINGRYKVSTTGDEAGDPHGNRPIYKRVDGPGVVYLYFTTYWTFGSEPDGSGEMYYYSAGDQDCPDSTESWYNYQTNMPESEIRITEASSEGKCPKNYPMCGEDGDCRTTKGKPPVAEFAPDAATLPSDGSPEYTSIRGTQGGVVNHPADLCIQDYEACPKNYPFCTKEFNCVIDDCADGFGTDRNKAEICHSPRRAFSPEETPWRCSDPWRCSQTSPSGQYNMIYGFDGKTGSKCTENYKVRMCPKNTPLCYDGNCVAEECKEECEEGRQKKKGIGDANKNPCNRNYQVPYCPKNYPECWSSGKICRVENSVAMRWATRPGVIPTATTKFTFLRGYDGKGHECLRTPIGWKAEHATCPSLYPLCIRGSCRTLDPLADAHPVWAMYPETKPEKCVRLSGSPCNSIRGYDGLGANCDQNRGAPLKKHSAEEAAQACPPEYPHCEKSKGNCVIPECINPAAKECKDRGWRRPETYLPGDKPGDDYEFISGLNNVVNASTKKKCKASYYKVRRCPLSYPVCYEGNCIIDRCRPGVGDPCVWHDAEVNPFTLVIPEPDSNASQTGQFNRIRGYDGIGNTCNERFEASCPPSYPICVKKGKYAGDCIIETCKAYPGLDNIKDRRCQATTAAADATIEPQEEEGKTIVNRVHKDGKGTYAMPCSTDYQVSMCPRYYPTCLTRGNNQGDCVVCKFAKGKEEESCNQMRDAPAYDTDPEFSFDYIFGIDGYGAPCNENFEEMDVYLYASEQDLLAWLTEMKAWHTSISVGKTEYWYDPEGGGTIKEEKFVFLGSKLPKEKQWAPRLNSHIESTSGIVPKKDSGDKVEVYKIYLGHTSKHGNVMVKELQDLFQIPDAGYDIVYRNSNTFTDFALWSLLGIRLSKDWNDEHAGYDDVKTVDSMLQSPRGAKPTLDPDKSFNFGAAERKVNAQPALYDQARELFSLLGMKLGNQRWYDQYICRSAKEEVSRAWESPKFRPRKGHMVLEPQNIKAAWMEPEEIPRNLANGGKNALTQADKVVPADAKAFLNLLDLLIANCFSMLYKQQAKLGSTWRAIETSEEMNPMSAIPEDVKKMRDKEYWAWQNHLWEYAGESYDPLKEEPSEKLKTLSGQLGKSDRETYEDVMKHLDDKTPASQDTHLKEPLQLVGSPRFRTNHAIHEKLKAEIDKAFSTFQEKKQQLDKARTKVENRIDVMKNILDLSSSVRANLFGPLSRSVKKGVVATKKQVEAWMKNAGSYSKEDFEEKVNDIDKILRSVPRKLRERAMDRARPAVEPEVEE